MKKGNSAKRQDKACAPHLGFGKLRTATPLGDSDVAMFLTGDVVTDDSEQPSLPTTNVTCRFRIRAAQPISAFAYSTS